MVWKQLDKGLETEDQGLVPHMGGSEVTGFQTLEFSK